MMTTKAIISLFLLFVCLVLGSEYKATWIEGPDGAMPDRADPSVVQDSKGNLWLFGGSSNDFLNIQYNDVWKLDVKKNYTWSAITNWPANDTGKYPAQRGMSGPDYRPPPRHNALTWLDSDDNIWIMGGTPDWWITYIPDFWMFNTTSLQWKLINEPMAAEWGTKGTGVYNVTYPGENSGAVTWTDFESNELWFLAGGTETWRSDVWKYSIVTGVWTWMAGPKEININATEGLVRGAWYSADLVNGPPVWGATGTRDKNGNVWFHGGNIPGYFISNQLWSFRPSTLEYMWVSGSDYDQPINVTPGQVQPPASAAGVMSYIGNDRLLYWPGYTNIAPYYIDHLFVFNTSSYEWTFISGTINGSYTDPQYGKFQQADASNYPGTRGDVAAISMGSLWIVRGSYDNSPDSKQHRDTFVFSVDICQTDLNPCNSNAKCTAYTAYAECACNSGYEGDGYTCAATVSPTTPTTTTTPTKTPSAKASSGSIISCALAIVLVLLMNVM